MTQRPNRWAGALVNDTERPGSQVIVEPIVTDHSASEHRIAGAAPSRHARSKKTLPQFRAKYIIKMHGGSLKAISTRRAAR